MDPTRRGRPFVRWKDRMNEYMHERVADRGGGIELARRDYLNRERRRFFCHGHPLSRGNEGSETIETKHRTRMDEVRNEDVQRRTGDTRVGWSSRALCVEVVWMYRENGVGLVSEQNKRI